MAGWSGGTFTRAHDWTTDEAAGENIEASRMDTEDDNFAAGINACLHKGGLNAATGDLPMGGNKHTGVGNGTARAHYSSVGQVQDGAYRYGTSGGSANVVTLTLTPAISAYVAGQTFVMLMNASNTGAATLNVNGLGAKDIYSQGEALVGYEMVINQVCVVVYDGTQFHIIDPSNPITCAVTLTTNESIAETTYLKIPWDASPHDYGDFWSSGASTRLTIPIDGIYTVCATARFSSYGTGGIRELMVYVNNSQVPGSSVVDVNTSSPTGARDLNVVMPDTFLNAADYVEIVAYQDGSSLAMNLVYQYTKASIRRVR